MQVTRDLGVYTEEYQRIQKGQIPNEKYIGVCSRESLPINTMRVAFATRVMKVHTPRKTTNRTSCILGSVVNPTRMNSVTRMIVLLHGLKKLYLTMKELRV